ncbi:innexin unc-9-like [Haliotis rubra]|uniref:innexin unc-9-like n=1 Tax=Haliotis rubra TaxID=36100 RepID=UPI001EE5A7A2|nr:innexin unc-9-like [Haliotis rubra]XP_046563570.1 innexin unc-9-like [Haliotis rubra]XP_046563571.1 innexin unc-9-like [Haliotis rubra]
MSIMPNHTAGLKNTYYIPMDTPIPVDHAERDSEELTYYQWVPLILLFQAFMFKFPNILWRVFNGGAGINLDKIVEMAEQTQMGSPEDRNTTIEHIAKYMDRWLETHREYHWNIIVRAKQKMARFCCFFCNKRAGTYLTAFYLFIKVLYAANVIAQFFILNAFLATEYNMYGFDVMAKLASGQEWKESPRFPRVTLCDFKIRQLQNIQTWTVQCVLPINLFNEKIFIFIWFWLVLVAALTCVNMVAWLYRVMFKRNRPAYIKKYLKISNELHTGSDKKLCAKFADQYLRDDGVFVIRVISKNSTDLVATDLVFKLWQIYKDKTLPSKNPEDDEPTGEDVKESLA